MGMADVADPNDLGYNQMFEQLFEAHQEQISDFAMAKLKEEQPEAFSVPRQKLGMDEHYADFNPAYRQLDVSYQCVSANRCLCNLAPPGPVLRLQLSTCMHGRCDLARCMQSMVLVHVSLHGVHCILISWRALWLRQHNMRSSSTDGPLQQHCCERRRSCRACQVHPKAACRYTPCPSRQYRLRSPLEGVAAESLMIPAAIIGAFVFSLGRSNKGMPRDMEEAREYAQSAGDARKDGVTGASLADVAGLDSVLNQFNEYVSYLQVRASLTRALGQCRSRVTRSCGATSGAAKRGTTAPHPHVVSSLGCRSCCLL